MPRDYDASAIERKWQKRWEEEKVYETDLKSTKNPFFTHVMFPYPSGDKLHVGHWYNFAPADSFARFKRMQGYDVFSPIGFDAFGLPAENYAIKTGIHPSKSIAENMKTMTEQLKKIGCMYDWGKSVNTSSPAYYRWTQWLFLQMFANDLAYRKEGNVNFCPSCQTVLANEQVWEGKCERCESDVIQKPLTQWYWKITKYAEKLLHGLDDLDWPEKTKTMQRNWIGRSEGINIRYDIIETMRGVIGWNGEPCGINSAREGGVSTEDPGLKPGANMEKMLDAGFNEEEVKRMLAAGFSPQREDSSSLPGRIHSSWRTTHITFTPYDRNVAFSTPRDSELILRIIESTAQRHSITIHEACIMSDHIHLLISFDKKRNLETDIIKKLKGASAREYLKKFNGLHQHLWGRKMHFTDIGEENQFNTVLKYIQNNPEKDGIDPASRLLSSLPLTVTCFTTRPDTNFGATFIVLAPEHPFVTNIVQGAVESSLRNEVAHYAQESQKKTELMRKEEGTKKSGVFTGYYALNNLNGKKLPIWISDFVLGSVGTGAVVGVPGHDERDFVFAKTFDLPIERVVISADGDTSPITSLSQVQESEGTMINSSFLDGLTIMDAKEKMKDRLELMGWGERITTWRLRDWSIGRQRYWGALIPIVYDPEGNPHSIPEEHLPWLLPTDVEFKPTGTAPIAQSKELKERTERIFGKGWTPEVDTMDTFVCSSFYSYRYLAEGNQKEFVQKDIEKKWMPVQMYIGGAEHSCMHLIYSRFVGMVLADLGFVKHGEQYQKLVHQGVITNQGAKMSKSKGNVVSPDGFVEKYGSDIFRMFLMFMGPFTEGGDWSDTGIKGISRFARRVHSFFVGLVESDCLPTRQGKCPPAGKAGKVPARTGSDGENDDLKIISLLHSTVKKVTDDIERLHFNTAISALMIFLNEAEKIGSVTLDTAQTFVKLFSPLAPHLAQELWERIGKEGFVIDAPWPAFDVAKIIADRFTLVVQVNGKVRANIEVPSDISEEEAIERAKCEENVWKFIEGKSLRKAIYIRNRLVNLVI